MRASELQTADVQRLRTGKARYSDSALNRISRLPSNQCRLFAWPHRSKNALPAPCEETLLTPAALPIVPGVYSYGNLGQRPKLQQALNLVSQIRLLRAAPPSPQRWATILTIES